MFSTAPAAEMTRCGATNTPRDKLITNPDSDLVIYCRYPDDVSCATFSLIAQISHASPHNEGCKITHSTLRAARRDGNSDVKLSDDKRLFSLASTKVGRNASLVRTLSRPFNCDSDLCKRRTSFLSLCSSPADGRELRGDPQRYR